MQPLEFAPDWRGASGWRNVAAAVDLRHDLAGHAVFVLFFTPQCVHSRAALQQMALLDARFAGRALAVVGVATPRAPYDLQLDEVLAECHVRFPVALDSDGSVFAAYSCAAWPTLVVIDGTGRVRFHGIGEPDPQALLAAAKTLLAEVEYGGQAPVIAAVPRVAPPPFDGALACPSGLAVDVGRGALWVADTLRHRVLELDLATGALRGVIGSIAGAGDGERAHATLCAPRGLAIAPDGRLLIADCGNHLLRVLEGDTVRTLLGTGARSFDRAGGACGVGQGLAFPSGLALDSRELWCAMVGAHQVWRMRWSDGVAEAALGSGVLGHSDDRALTARLAQPRAVAVRDQLVAVCDTGNHAVRVWDRARDAVTTVAGVPGQPGDRDGDAGQAMFQYPSALLFDGDDLLVADTGNGKLRRVVSASRQVETLPGLPAGCRPTALALHGPEVFVADGNRGAVHVLDLRRGAGRTLPLSPMLVPTPRTRARVRARADCVFEIPLSLPAGASVHPDLPVRAYLRNMASSPLATDLEYTARVVGSSAVLHGVKTAPATQGVLRAELRYFTRHGEGRAVHAHELSFECELCVEEDAPIMARWSHH